MPAERQKFYVVAAFPYPNGPMHLGHLGTFLPADFVVRYRKLQGYDVLYPMGWHVTGNPVFYIALRLQQGDKKIYEMFTKIYKIPEEIVKQFVDPYKILDYFISQMKEAMQRLNLMIDWSREFRTSDPQFQKFIQWQFRKLKEKGYIIKGKYPVAWCPKEQQPIGKGSAERSEGEDADIVEMTIIKFYTELDGQRVVLPVATLRPETVFGVTNLWINPELDYWLVEVNGEPWIVVKEAIIKLKDQEKEVKEVRRIDPKELLFKPAYLDLGELVLSAPIVPASFVSSDKGTGIVMSVPAHDPYDYVAYRLALEKYPELQLPKPRKVIDTPYDFDKLLKDVEDEHDPRLEKLKQEVYKAELEHKYTFGQFAGLSTEEARQRIIEYLKQHGVWDHIYELSERAVCRCGAVLHVKIIDQWFINYGDPSWKQLAREWLEQARIYPEKWRKALEHAIEWVDKRPCARRTGIGTPFPFEEGWKIEPLSDSTIYMAFFTIAPIAKTIEPEKLTDEVFDYVFLGKGDPEEISRKTGIEKEKIIKMREEFLKWYPLDINFTGQDLLNNHSTFYIFNHVAIFPRELWPKGLAISGIGRYEGQEMHKSKGTAKAVLDYLRQYPSYVIRLWYSYTSEYGEDFSYYERDLDFIVKRVQDLEKLWSRLEPAVPSEAPRAESILDAWILSEYNAALRRYKELFEEFRFRTLTVMLIVELYSRLKFYLELGGSERVASWILRNLLVMLWPLAPALAEKLLKTEPKSLPEPASLERELSAEFVYSYLTRLLEDIKQVKMLFERKHGKEPRKLYLYVAPDKYYEILKEMIEGKELKELAKKYQVDFKFLQRLKKLVYSYNLKEFPEFDEQALLNSIKDYLRRTFGFEEVHVFKYLKDKHIYDPSGKAPLSTPYKPSMWLE